MARRWLARLWPPSGKRAWDGAASPEGDLEGRLAPDEQLEEGEA